MERIIYDTYSKNEKHTWDLDPENENNQKFNKRILAVNNMYGWMYENGLLEKVSFWMKDYEDEAYFAFDANDLLPYREYMERNKVEDAALAVHHIFDEEYTPCRYSGAIQLGWTMMTYRDFGNISSSWECGLVKHLNTEWACKVLETKKEKGVKDAVLLAAGNEWEPTPKLKENLFQKVVKRFPDEFGSPAHYECFDPLYANKLIYVYQQKHEDLKALDAWVHCEELLGEKLMSYDEYFAIEKLYNGDLQNVERTDKETITSFREYLERYRNRDTLLQEGKLVERKNMDKNLLALIDEADGEMLFLEPEFNQFSDAELQAMLEYVAATPALEGYIEFDFRPNSDRLVTIYKGVKEVLV